MQTLKIKYKTSEEDLKRIEEYMRQYSSCLHISFNRLEEGKTQKEIEHYLKTMNNLPLMNSWFIKCAAYNCNGGHRNITTAQTLKAEGVLAGVSDLILLYPNKTYHALCIEMKTDRGTQSPRQKEWAKRVMAQGYLYVVCRSLQDFILTVNSYLNDERVL